MKLANHFFDPSTGKIYEWDVPIKIKESLLSGKKIFKKDIHRIKRFWVFLYFDYEPGKEVENYLANYVLEEKKEKIREKKRAIKRRLKFLNNWSGMKNYAQECKRSELK